jgi:hypothetical protein
MAMKYPVLMHNGQAILNEAPPVLAPVGRDDTILPLETNCVWLQQPRETNRAYQMFCTYLKLGPSRSLHRARVKWHRSNGLPARYHEKPEDAYLKPKDKNWERVARIHLWEQRAVEYDRSTGLGHVMASGMTTIQCVSLMAKSLKRSLLSDACQPRNSVEALEVLQSLMSLLPKEAVAKLIESQQAETKPVQIEKKIEAKQDQYESGAGI